MSCGWKRIVERIPYRIDNSWMEVYSNWKLLKSSINLLNDVSHLSYVFIVREEIKSIIEIS